VRHDNAPEDGYLDLRRLSRYASISVRRLRDLIKDPAQPLPVFRVGAKILVKRSDFDGWLERHHRPGPGVDDTLAAIRSARR